MALKSVALSPFTAPVIAFGLAQAMDGPDHAFAWALTTVMVSLAAIAMLIQYGRLFGTRLWGLAVPSMLVGSLWGYLPWAIRPTDRIDQALVLLAVLIAGTIGAMTAAPTRVAFHSYLLPHMTLSFSYAASVDNDRLNRLSPLIWLIYLSVSGAHAQFRRTVHDTLRANDENEKLVRTLEKERSQLASANTALTEVNAVLTHRSVHDPLTGLLNRSGIGDRMLKIQAELHPGSGVALVYFDLDRFKLVNDAMGHDFGDRLLAVVAERCVESIGSASLARLGGDEFCALFYPVRDAREARANAEALRHTLDRLIEIDGRRLLVSASFGVAVSFGETSVDELRRFADTALYRAKEQGRNRVVFFDEPMQRDLVQRVDRGADLRRAFQQRLIVPWFQPEICLSNAQIVGAESLARWVENGTARPAGQFMPIAEEVGLELPISDRIVNEVVKIRGIWHRDGLDPNFRVRINVTAQQICDRAHVDGFLEAMERFGCPGSGLSVEVTETGVIRDIATASESLRAARAAGVAVALDDFGTGHSSLSLLQQLPLDAVKIDRSFVRDLEDDSRDRALVRTIISLAHELGLSVTAEGVETERQAEILRGMGCTHAQGFLYSHAVPADELLAKVRLPLLTR